jgi:hypothetical protein
MTSLEQRPSGGLRRASKPWIAIVSALFVLAFGYYAVNGLWGDGIEVPLSALDDSEHGVVYLPSDHLFVIATMEGPIVLSDGARHLDNDPVSFCSSSGMFEGPLHGEMFDRLGRYFAGPVQGDMASVPSEVVGSKIHVNTDAALVLPGRSTGATVPLGPNCNQFGDESGFASNETGS